MGWSGKGKGFRKPPPAIPADMEVDANARYAGVVSAFYKWHGYGFIELAVKGVVPDDKIFVHWTSIKTNDRFPFLLKGQQVEFSLLKWTEGWGENKMISLRAKDVTQQGGTPLEVQDSFDQEKKTFVGDLKSRYTGTLKFYNPMRGFGYVTLDDGFSLGDDVPKEIRVEEAEVNCGGRRPVTWVSAIPVEFGIVRNRQGKYLAYNMTMRGGAPLSRENMENRKVFEEQTFTGVLNFFSWRSGWGFIMPEAEGMLPPDVRQKLAEMTAAAKEKGKEPKDNMIYVAKSDFAQGTAIKPEMRVVFKVYTDDKGAGACDVRAVE
mmetsp:Transcript_22672/g.52930  ORF Transcript_22672/g.52930 Transcript_22672/m.52930 type:complete len:320 (+) Transcript_22672:89-1048(+)